MLRRPPRCRSIRCRRSEPKTYGQTESLVGVGIGTGNLKFTQTLRKDGPESLCVFMHQYPEWNQKRVGLSVALFRKMGEPSLTLPV